MRSVSPDPALKCFKHLLNFYLPFRKLLSAAHLLAFHARTLTHRIYDAHSQTWFTSWDLTYTICSFAMLLAVFISPGSRTASPYPQDFLQSLCQWLCDVVSFDLSLLFVLKSLYLVLPFYFVKFLYLSVLLASQSCLLIRLLWWTDLHLFWQVRQHFM